MHLLIVVVFFSLPLFSQDSALISKEIKVHAFKGLVLDLPAKFIFYSRQKNNSVILKIDKNFLNAVKVKVQKENLSIKSIKNINTDLPITIIINSTNEGLENIFIEGVTDLSVTHIRSDSLFLKSSGISHINFEDGKINQLSIDAEDEYIIKFTDVDIRKAVIKAEDIGKIILNVSKLLDVKLSDLVKVLYSGQAKIIESTEDFSELKKR